MLKFLRVLLITQNQADVFYAPPFAFELAAHTVQDGQTDTTRSAAYYDGRTKTLF